MILLKKTWRHLILLTNKIATNNLKYINSNKFYKLNYQTWQAKLSSFLTPNFITENAAVAVYNYKRPRIFRNNAKYFNHHLQSPIHIVNEWQDCLNPPSLCLWEDPYSGPSSKYIDSRWISFFPIHHLSRWSKMLF